MIIDKLTQKFLDKPIYLDKGAGYLAKLWKVQKEDIYKAKINAKDLKNLAYSSKLKSEIDRKDKELARYTGSKRDGDNVVKTFETTKPLTPKEIEDLAGVDGITTEIARVWDKLQTNGIWTYSIDIRYKIKDFYNREELREKLKEIFPDQKPYTLPYSLTYKDKALIISIADDHVGAVNVTHIYGESKLTYKDKLTRIIQEVQELNEVFDEVHIISLGDQLNGFNGNTTRGGHEVKSLSNKDQFDEYCSARVDFYNKLFSSGVGNNYFVHDVENSNHSGSGFSYMANQYLDMYLEAKFPQVVRTSIHDMIDGFEYGNHLILMGHGKDEKFMKRPMPCILDAKTDLFLTDYLLSKDYSPYKKSVTFYKGDLHQLGLQHGRFGRYVNVQSVVGNMDYGDSNFGNTRSGALLEILDKNSYKVSSQAIWF
jgi:hypothetical protein